MAAAWVLFPLILLAVCLGCGLLVERIAGWELPGGLLPAVGLALVIVAATLTTSNGTTAPLTTAAIIVLALAGYASGWRRLRSLRPNSWIVAVGLGVFAACAAPVVLSGNATFLGYFVDNDTAFHFAFVDQLLAHGHNLTGLRPSAYSSALQDYLGTAYPVGADAALGALRPLVGQDIAWIFQPYLAVILALGGVAIYELLRDVVRSLPMRASCAFIAAQAGLVYAFYLEGSIKELATTLIITLTIVLLTAILRERLRVRALVPLVIVGVAGLDMLDLAIVPWLGIPIAVFVIVAAWRLRHVVRRTSARRLLVGSAAAAAVLAALVAPLIGSASTFFRAASGVLASGNTLGNLPAPLQKWQILGIWPTGDFRFPVASHYRIAYALIGVAIAAAVLGASWMLRRRKFAPLLLLVGNGIATVYLLSRGTPYADAKTMMIFSMTAVLTAMLGAVALHDSGRRIEGWALAAVIAAGVLWTNVLAYRGASVAPRDRFAELAAIGGRFAGEGPTFYNVSDEFAIHFLRSEAPTVPSTWGPGPVPRPGLQARNGYQSRLPWDPNDLAPGYLQGFKLLVLARSPLTSRPPADFSLAYEGRYYDVWRRAATPQVIEHVSLGSGLHQGAVPSCRLVMGVAGRAASEHAQLAYSVDPPAPAFVPTEGAQTPNWGPVAGNAYEVAPGFQPGPVTGIVGVERPGRYAVWEEASISRRVSVWVGRQHIGSVGYYLGPPGQFVRVGDVSLRAGKQPVMIAPAGSNLAPGQTVRSELLGPLVLVRDAAAPPVSEIAPRDARSLCGRRLNWVEIVR